LSTGASFLFIISTIQLYNFSVLGQVFFDFNEGSNSSTYLTYDNSTAGIGIKYPPAWDILEHLGNVSGNSIVVDFYHAGINGTRGFSENANVVVSSPGAYSFSPAEKSEIASSTGIQPANPNPTASSSIFSFMEYLDAFTDATTRTLNENINNFTLLESHPMIISGLPGHKITYTILDNQSEIKQTQAWTTKDDKWFVITYSAEPSAYFNSRTAENIIKTLVLR
jgi:hypothetical protein